MKIQVSVLAALATIPVVSAQLNELARAAGKLYFGTATDNGELNNTQYTAILDNKKEFGQLTPSNGQKWMYVEPSQGVFDFGPGSVVADRAAKNKQLLRCHTLVWHSQLPDWVNNGVWGKENLTDVLINHITHVAGHWKGRCHAWDVVNEGLNDDGTYRETVFYKTLGEEYFKIAFATAARIDPHAKLYYNDYNLEAPSAKSTAAQNIVKMLGKAGIKIDGIGAQAHLIVGSTPSIDAQIANIKAFTALGVEVAQTELDIRLNLPSTPENLEQQRKDYEATVGACMQVKGCVGTTVWDFYDPFSWVPTVFNGQGDATLYFANFTKHPAYYGVVSALQNATKSHGGKGHGEKGHPHWLW